MRLLLKSNEFTGFQCKIFDSLDSYVLWGVAHDLDLLKGSKIGSIKVLLGCRAQNEVQVDPG